MTVSRAGFLKLCGLALAGAGVDLRAIEGICDVPSAMPAAGRRAAGFRVQDATAAHFRDHLTTSFDLHAADGASARLMLAEVSERPLTKNVEQFSLIFHAPPGPVVPDGIHSLDHPALGRFDLFIVPVGAPDVRRTTYQACFSRHVSVRQPRRSSLVENVENVSHV